MSVVRTEHAENAERANRAEHAGSAERANRPEYAASSECANRANSANHVERVTDGERIVWLDWMTDVSRQVTSMWSIPKGTDLYSDVSDFWKTEISSRIHSTNQTHNVMSFPKKIL